ncbi:MAG TPA: LysM peptidoglycan-binding domain-containing protein [Candidatus Hydrogenedentes bacterium]|nr:LysM peptidoglycan-binding domain-containing protein [Candidatus Hydrogenedentota bacterium]
MSESRYEECEALKDGGREYLGVRLPVEIPPRPDDRFHTVVTGDRLDVLAQRYLRNASLWPLICDCSDIASPLDLHPGTVLRIPAIDRLFV